MLRTSINLLIICLFLGTNLCAQGEADQWVIGYNFSKLPDDTIHGTTVIDFNEGPVKFNYKPDLTLDFSGASSAISTSKGELLFMTNGLEIRSADNHHIVDTIARLGEGIYWDSWYLSQYNTTVGLPIPQGAIILPMPGYLSEYMVIYCHYDYNDTVPYYVPMTLLQARLKVVLGEESTLIYKDSSLLKHNFFTTGKIAACRHGNGRDWWILVGAADSKNTYRFLLNPSGLHLNGIAENVFTREGIGQAWFSANGKWYATYASYSYMSDYILTLYTFDRCTGALDIINQINIPHEELSAFGGMTFSPDSKYLYANTNWDLYQFDLTSLDIPASRMHIDTFDGFVEPGWFITPFSFMHTAPDGRIYVIPPTGSSRYMHVIRRPNERGEACDFRQHSIKLPTWNGRSTPNYANFRLGPVDGSPCDTLGLDNHPVAKWRYEPDDEEEAKTIRFTDLSFFDPQAWYWEFGDGSTSEEQNPIHTYLESGLYEVCLTVSNANSEDTDCQMVEILSTSTHEFSKASNIEVGPNPFGEEIRIKPPQSYRNFRIRLLNAEGRVVEDVELPCHCSISTRHLPAGIYFYTLEEDGLPVQSGRLVKGG